MTWISSHHINSIQGEQNIRSKMLDGVWIRRKNWERRNWERERDWERNFLHRSDLWEEEKTFSCQKFMNTRITFIHLIIIIFYLLFWHGRKPFSFFPSLFPHLSSHIFLSSLVLNIYNKLIQLFSMIPFSLIDLWRERDRSGSTKTEGVEKLHKREFFGREKLKEREREEKMRREPNPRHFIISPWILPSSLRSLFLSSFPLRNEMREETSNIFTQSISLPINPIHPPSFLISSSLPTLFYSLIKLLSLSLWDTLNSPSLPSLQVYPHPVPIHQFIFSLHQLEQNPLCTGGSLFSFPRLDTMKYCVIHILCVMNEGKSFQPWKVFQCKDFFP